MARRRNRQKMLPALTIEKIAAEGKAMTRHNGKVIFVENAMPGDTADVLLTKRKKDYAIGKAVKIITPSPDRIAPFCKHFDDCGGCKWQFMSYDKQAEYKQQIVQEAFERVGKLVFPPIQQIVKAEKSEYYRNKMEFSCNNKRWLNAKEIAETAKEVTINRNAIGFHVPGMFDRIVDIEHCYLQDEPSNAIRNSIRDYAFEHGLSFYDVYKHEGFLRNIIVRTSTLNQLMIIVSFGYDDVPTRTALLDYLLQQFPNITALHYVVNTKKNDTLYDLDIVTYHGPGFIVETLAGLEYKISPKSFFQTNSHQALALYTITKQFAQLQAHETVYDLYTGTGSIAIFVANACKQVIGIETVAAAIVDAKYNAQLNGINNTHFYAGDVKDLFTDELIATHGKPDVLITDPPRAGMHKAVIEQILAVAPNRIVYVSCNPVTQARDLQLLQAKYAIERVQPVDMFPHTYHIENVVLLVKK